MVINYGLSPDGDHCHLWEMDEMEEDDEIGGRRDESSFSARQLDRQYGHLFDARIVNCQLEESLTQLISLLQAIESKPSWVPLSWATQR